jgi:ABC-type branched-subunit amino acid transport system ATPase component
MTTPAILSATALCKNYGALKVTDQVDFSLPPGARHALIGPNGAGKSTLINLLTGKLKPSSGRIFLRGVEITAMAPETRARRGIVRTFQINTLFPKLTPMETVALAIAQRRGEGGSLLAPMSRRGKTLAEAADLLEQFDLAADAGRQTRELPYGKQRLLEIATAFAMKPQVLLLDEPAAGIPAKESDEIFSVIAALPREVAILFIEHDMELVFKFAERIHVLVAGRIVASGDPATIAADPAVRAVYLG